MKYIDKKKKRIGKRKQLPSRTCTYTVARGYRYTGGFRDDDSVLIDSPSLTQSHLPFLLYLRVRVEVRI